MKVYKSSIWVFAALLFVVFMVPAAGHAGNKHVPPNILVDETSDLVEVGKTIEETLDTLPKGKPYQILKTVIIALQAEIELLNGRITALETAPETPTD